MFEYKSNSRLKLYFLINAVHRHFEKRQGTAVILLIRAQGYATHYLSQIIVHRLIFSHSYWFKLITFCTRLFQLWWRPEVLQPSIKSKAPVSSSWMNVTLCLCFKTKRQTVETYDMEMSLIWSNVVHRF